MGCLEIVGGKWILRGETVYYRVRTGSPGGYRIRRDFPSWGRVQGDWKKAVGGGYRSVVEVGKKPKTLIWRKRE